MPVAPTQFKSLKPTRRGGKIGRTITAALRTAADMRRQVIGDAIAAGQLPSRVGGLRGGRAVVRNGVITLLSTIYIPGVKVSGTVPVIGTRQVLKISGTKASHGTLTVTPTTITGRLDGRKININAQSAAAASVTASGAPLSRAQLDALMRRARLRGDPLGRVGVMANALAGETSPYLLQHRDNPVDWMPWGEQALKRARELDRPLLVSIGYSACHWCHVMERECFENPEIAALMNEHFVCVKVDREERPDVDAIYMEAVQAMTGHGGWPLNVFITPEQVPFYAGTYFPPEQRQGMPSWPAVLGGVAQAWELQRDEIRAQSEAMIARLSGAALLKPAEQPPGEDALVEAVAKLSASYDSVNGGWGTAPKFPAASTIEFLLRRGARSMSLQTLRSMAGGGINDQIGGGFARYSVDATWTVPHFEKMLYDNALLARAYLHGWLVSGGADGGDPRAAAHRRGDARLDPARDDRPRGRLLLGAGRRLRGRRGQVLRLVARRAARRARRRLRGRGGVVRRQRPGQLRGPEHPRVARAGADRRGSRADPRDVAGGARGARAARTRRQAPDGLERAGDQRAGRRRRRAAARRLPRRRAPRRRLPARDDARRRRAPAAHIQRRAGEAQRLPRGPRVPARGARDALRGDVRAALVSRPRATPPTR